MKKTILYFSIFTFSLVSLYILYTFTKDKGLSLFTDEIDQEYLNTKKYTTYIRNKESESIVTLCEDIFDSALVTNGEIPKRLDRLISSENYQRFDLNADSIFIYKVKYASDKAIAEFKYLYSFNNDGENMKNVELSTGEPYSKIYLEKQDNIWIVVDLFFPA